MSSYIKGRQHEYNVADLFKANGYMVVRSAGSHGKWDFTAVKCTQKNEYEVRVMVIGECKVRRKR